MILITAKEARDIALESIGNEAIVQVMKQIINACKNGQFSVTVSREFSPPELEFIEKALTELNYKFIVKEENYIGSFKKRISIKISWND